MSAVHASPDTYIDSRGRLHRKPYLNPDVMYGTRCRQLIRCLRILQAITINRYMTVALLAGKFKVSTKTIRRDLRSLEIAGLPIRRIEAVDTEDGDSRKIYFRCEKGLVY